MLLFDVNIVVAAFREDHPHHTPVRAWFDHVMASQEDFGVPLTVWASFLELVTHRRVFTEPATVAEAFDFIDSVRSQPGHLNCEPGPRHLRLVQEQAEAGDGSGALIPDVVLAAIALEHGAKLVSLDRDFARFPALSVVRPQHVTAPQ